MPRRNESERDFILKSSIRAILWAQGYSTRLDVLLSSDKDVQGKNGSRRAGLTDLDVLGIRLDPGFRVHTAIADCKTTTGQVPERLFWLSGVGKFFGSDTNLLVRSQPIPSHAIPLARNLDITLIGPEDLSILSNTYVTPARQALSQIWQDFFSADLLGDALARLSRLPQSLIQVEEYRETRYWMDEPYRRLNQILVALQTIAKDGSAGPTFQLVFADFVWLYIVALWDALETVNAGGLSRIERGLGLYISGNEAGLRNLQRMKQSFEVLARNQTQGEISLSIEPPYFKNLLEVIVRCVRRPGAVAKMARRAEWLVIGQIIGNLGSPPWELTDDDLICSKLIGDVAKFMVSASGLKMSFLDFYLDLLQDLDVEQSNSSTLEDNSDMLGEEHIVDDQMQEKEANVSDPSREQLGFSELEGDNTLNESL